MNSATTYDEKTKVWSSPRNRSVFAENCSVGLAAFYVMTSQLPETVCQISDSEDIELTYGTATKYAIRVAQHLQQFGVTQDDVVGFLAPHTSMMFPVVLGCLMNGTPFHGINVAHEAKVVKHIFDITKPKMIFCDGNLYARAKEAVSGRQVMFYTLCNHVKGVPRVEDLLEPTETEKLYVPASLKYGATQTAAICISSGTTGLPKGVPVSHATLTRATGWFLNGSDVIFSFSSLDWLMGLLCMVFVALRGGKRIITTKSFTTDYLFELINKYKITYLTSTPNMLSQMVRSPKYTKEAMSSVKYILFTGGPSTEATLQLAREQLAPGHILIHAYGSTEVSGVACNFDHYKPKSVGPLVRGIRVKLLDEDTGLPVGPHKVGVLHARGEHPWRGYYASPSSQREALDADGWFNSGDLAYFDDEHYLHVVGRCKDIMKYRIFHYSPLEIEQTIAELPDVVDVCVFGIWDESVGDAAAAAVVRRPGSTLSAEEVVAHVASRQEVEHKRLHAGVFFVPEIVRNFNGKIMRKRMRELCVGEAKVY